MKFYSNVTPLTIPTITEAGSENQSFYPHFSRERKYRKADIFLGI